MICHGLTRKQANDLYLEVLESKDNKALRRLAKEDLFFLLTVGCKRKDADHDWIYGNCREVESEPDGYLDLWAREHFKSSTITFALTIKDILNDPNLTVGIFSHTRPIAKAFLSQIKQELEQNTFLKNLFPDVLWAEPKSQAPKWSLDSGIIVKRDQNPKESTIEAWGLVDGQPTSKHFGLMVYDDVVTRESVSTPEQIKKTTAAWELSTNLGAQGGKKRYIGTRYHANDTYKTMMDRGSVKARIKPAREGGKMDGRPVFMSDELLIEKRRDQGPYTFGAQMLLDPVADKSMGFKPEWLCYYKSALKSEDLNLYLLIDPASEKKSTSDYTVMKVIGLGPDNNYYFVDGVRDRMNLTERTEKLFYFHRKYKPIKTAYEKYGKDSDIEHIKYVMEEKNYRFDITPVGGALAKEDRIKRLVPIFEQKRMWLPERLMFVDYEGRSVDYIHSFVNDEYLAFPVCVHDDMLDCMARILDPLIGAEFPKAVKAQPKPPTVYRGGTGWMG
jgi:predicted phage terminase large subunit-like protein